MKKKLITLVCLVGLTFNAEASVMNSIRGVLNSVIGTKWTETLLGSSSTASTNASFKLPAIPSAEQLKLPTSVDAHIEKDKTEFDQLPNERIRQYNFKFLEELFLATRRTEARDEDLSTWMNTLDQGGSREGIYQALVLDNVYNTLESIENGSSTEVKEFVVKFSQDFLNQMISSESLEQFNHYTLKRIITEKGLDIMEYYQTKSLDDLYKWYALCSSFMASGHGKSFIDNPVRSNTSADYHYQWALNMPIQHIKSEFIIKVHKLMNDAQEI